MNVSQVVPSIEGSSIDGDFNEPFVAKVAVTPVSFITPHGSHPIDMEKNLKKLRHKRDVRNAPLTVKLACIRFCARQSAETATELPRATENTESVATDAPELSEPLDEPDR